MSLTCFLALSAMREAYCINSNLFEFHPLIFIVFHVPLLLFSISPIINGRCFLIPNSIVLAKVFYGIFYTSQCILEVFRINFRARISTKNLNLNLSSTDTVEKQPFVLVISLLIVFLPLSMVLILSNFRSYLLFYYSYKESSFHSFFIVLASFS